MILNAAHAQNVAELIVARFKDTAESVRVAELTIHPEKVPASQWPEVLGRDLLDVVNVEFSPPAGDAIDQDVRIESIRMDIAPGSWEVTWGLFPLSTSETTEYWELGVSLLDVGTRLA